MKKADRTSSVKGSQYPRHSRLGGRVAHRMVQVAGDLTGRFRTKFEQSPAVRTVVVTAAISPLALAAACSPTVDDLQPPGFKPLYPEGCPAQTAQNVQAEDLSWLQSQQTQTLALLEEHRDGGLDPQAHQTLCEQTLPKLNGLHQTYVKQFEGDRTEENRELVVEARTLLAQNAVLLALDDQPLTSVPVSQYHQKLDGLETRLQKNPNDVDAARQLKAAAAELKPAYDAAKKREALYALTVSYHAPPAEDAEPLLSQTLAKEQLEEVKDLLNPPKGGGLGPLYERAVELAEWGEDRVLGQLTPSEFKRIIPEGCTDVVGAAGELPTLAWIRSEQQLTQNLFQQYKADPSQLAQVEANLCAELPALNDDMKALYDLRRSNPSLDNHERLLEMQALVAQKATLLGLNDDVIPASAPVEWNAKLDELKAKVESSNFSEASVRDLVQTQDKIIAIDKKAYARHQLWTNIHTLNKLGDTSLPTFAESQARLAHSEAVFNGSGTTPGLSDVYWRGESLTRWAVDRLLRNESPAYVDGRARQDKLVRVDSAFDALDAEGATAYNRYSSAISAIQYRNQFWSHQYNVWTNSSAVYSARSAISTANWGRDEYNRDVNNAQYWMNQANIGGQLRTVSMYIYESSTPDGNDVNAAIGARNQLQDSRNGYAPIAYKARSDLSSLNSSLEKQLVERRNQLRA